MAKHRLLIVEDDPGLNQSLRAYFKWDYEVVTADDGQVAYHLAQISEPDLIILDIILPTMDGIEFCHMIKAIPNLRTIPVIVITGKPLEEIEDFIKEMGIGIILQKPFEMKDLATHINDLLFHIPPIVKKMTVLEIQGYE